VKRVVFLKRDAKLSAGECCLTDANAVLRMTKIAGDVVLIYMRLVIPHSETMLSPATYQPSIGREGLRAEPIWVTPLTKCIRRLSPTAPQKAPVPGCDTPNNQKKNKKNKKKKRIA
jgi:hypothetical protein